MVADLRSKSIVAAFFALLALLVTLAVLYSKNPEVDTGTGCVLDRVRRPITVILLDQSDQFEIGDVARARSLALRILRSLETDEKIVALEINPARPYEPLVLFDRCAPKRKGEWSIFFDNIKALETSQGDFETAFRSATEEAFSRKELATSPILESVAYVSRRDDFRTASARKLFLFSDLMQNYGSLNFYRHVPASADVSEDSLKLDSISLTNTVAAPILVARRQQWNKRPNLRLFWARWLETRGAVVNWQYGEGDGSAKASR